MRKSLLLFLLIFVCFGAASAQIGTHNANRLRSGAIDPGTGNPLTLSCEPGPGYTDKYLQTTDHSEWTCVSKPNNWQKVVAGSTPGAETDPVVKAINGIVKSNTTTISAAVAGTDYLTPTGSAAGLTSFPTLNQNTTGTASNVSGTPALPNGTSATTQTQGDGSTKIATDLYVDTGLATKQASGSYVLQLTTVCGHALSANVTCSPSDVSLGNVSNNAQLTIANNLSDLNNPATARTNLGLGALATQNGTFSGTSSGTNTGDQTFTASGDATAPGSTSNLALTLKNTGTPGTYRSTTFDAQGRETSGTNPTTFAGYGISDTSANFFSTISDETGSGSVVGSASPTLTGTPLSTTAAVDTNTTQIATTAFVLAQAASANPVIDGAAAPGTSTRYARADHVHPTDTSRAPTTSPTFTGTVGGTNVIPLTVLAQIATNTVAGNSTSGTANITALPIGSCSTSGSALIWTTNAGFSCNTSITANTATTATTATNATNAATITKADNVSYFLAFVAANSSSNQAIEVGPATYNPSTGVITSTSFAGAGTNLTGIPYAITGTANQVVASAATGNITLSLPQSIATGSSVQFGKAFLGTAAIGSYTFGVQTGTDQNLLIFGPQNLADGISLTSINSANSVKKGMEFLANKFMFTSGTVFMPNLSTDSGATDDTLCSRTSNGEVLIGTGTLGICLGTSSARFKPYIATLPVGLAEVMALNPVQYKLDAAHGDPNKLFYGFTAEQGGQVLPRLMGRDAEGQANTFDYLGIVPVLVRATQELQAEIESLRSELKALKEKP